jgi:microcystin-dependent protein
MSYNVNFTDKNRPPITVQDDVRNNDTSLIFVGRNFAGYGQSIAENFLALMENFSNTTPPESPVEGQLWYDTIEGILKIWDNINWKAASNIQKSVSQPSTSISKDGELWVDTANQQLNIFVGGRWVVVGPEFSNGLGSGPKVKSIKDSNEQDRVILIFYVEEIPLIIFSKDSFTPKIFIDGFPVIRSGLNVTSLNVGVGNFDTKLYGRATSSDSLIIAGNEIPGNKFLRSDVPNTIDFGLLIRNNSGLTIGTDGVFNLSASATAAKLYNSAPGSSLDFQVNRNGVPSTTVRILNGNVGINNLNPSEALAVVGNISVSGSILLQSDDPVTINTNGGISVAKKILANGGIEVTGAINPEDIVPRNTDQYQLGTAGKRWKTIRAEAVIADTITGTINGDITGTAGKAAELATASTFSIDGDVRTIADISFKGIDNVRMITTLDPAFINNKPSPSPNISIPTDTVLVSRPGVGLLKETRNVFVGDLGIPIGGILAYAGTSPPPGFLLCDGSELEISRYNVLYQVIGATYNTSQLNGINTFRLPDLRGRSALGRDNMDNGTTVPNINGTPINAGGGNANRVPGVEADTMGGSGGASSQVLSNSNLPDHEHSLVGSSGQQYYATRLDTAVPLDSGASLDRGPTLSNQAQYLPTSGRIKTSGNLSQPFSVLDPFLTINYIIRAGRPDF